MKTLQMLPIPEDQSNLLVHADNGVYELKIRYWEDTIDDIKEILTDLAPHLMTEEQLKGTEENF